MNLKTSNPWRSRASKVFDNFVIVCRIALPILIGWIFWDYSILLAIMVGLSWFLLIDDLFRHFVIHMRTRKQLQETEKIIPSSIFSSASLEDIPPFAVYLRAFGPESTHLREEANERWTLLHYSDPVTGRYLETLLVQICKPDLDVVGLANVYQEVHRTGIKWLDPSDNDWQLEIKNLIQRADCVFIYINGWSEGLQTEVDLLKPKILQQKTIVFISPTLAERKAEIMNSLTQNENEWTGILNVPTKKIPWKIILIVLLLGLIAWWMESMFMLALPILFLAAYNGRFEIQMFIFSRQIKSYLGNLAVSSK